ncbi:hypothetical protein ILUMI_18485 [Ignelater luminosus]|uniref:Uncharacterized protein n=1 Tax=Ignelater luminosus TaxID=2038154 RepID=A0A8K0CJU0_IGNLU|nr:hypothetical protein ILUMI_18485 [Ignelater luminosus]
MTAFIDLQGFRGDNKIFIPKEIAIISENGYKIAHLLLKPPYPVQSFGQLNFDDFERELSLFVKDFNTIYVKGEEKKNVLSFLDKTIINLEDLECPPLYKLKEKLVAVQCLNHNIASAVCAIENVIPGQHWNAFFIDENGYGEYFDSSGRPPEGNHLKFLEQNSVTWCYNSQILQSFTSDFCEIYCLVYLYFKPHYVSSLEFLNTFNDDLASNDCVVKLFYDFVFEKIII